MASKNIIYKVKNIPTLELIKKYEEAGYFFRFQEPHQKLTSRSKSWGMIYSSAREALKDDSTILNGKSCVSSAKELLNWYSYYNNSYVVLVFEGKERNESGHDGELVARFDKTIDVFEYNAFIELIGDED